MPENDDAIARSAAPGSGEKDLEELAERRLAERVEQQVRSKLFTVYAAIGGAALTILGFFGYSVISDFRNTAHDTATSSAEAAAKQAVEPIIVDAKAELTKVKEIEEEANKTIREVNNRLEVLAETLTKGQEQATQISAENEGMKTNVLATKIEMDDQLKFFKENTAKKVQDVDDQLQQFNEQAASKVKDINNKLQELDQDIDAQKGRAIGQFASAGTVSDLANLVQQLATNVHSLGDQVQKIAKQTATVLPPITADLTTEAANTAQVAAGPPAQPTVFFQFAVMSRNDARAISDALQGRGYVMPGEDQEAAASPLKQVRYFFEQDKSAANALADNTTAVLSDLGYGVVEIDVRDFTTYAGKKPHPGILELWLGVQPR